MRVILAAVFVVVGLSIAVGLLSATFTHTSHTQDVLIEIGMGVLFILLLVVASFLFDSPTGKWKASPNPNQYVEDLQEKGLIVSTDFQAVRAFQVEEYEDEGLHYFIELTDGSVLYLSGQDLYDYEPIEDDPELNQPRRFPCSDFTLRTHRTENFVIDIQCRGTVIEPEAVESHPKDFWKWEPEDGKIITDKTYDEIKMHLAGVG